MNVHVYSLITSYLNPYEETLHVHKRAVLQIQVGFFLYNRENYIHLFYTCPVNGIWCLEWGDFLHLLIYTEPKTGLSSHCMRADCRYAIIATGCLNVIILKSEHIYNRCCQCSTAVKNLDPRPIFELQQHVYVQIQIILKNTCLENTVILHYLKETAWWKFAALAEARAHRRLFDTRSVQSVHITPCDGLMQRKFTFKGDA